MSIRTIAASLCLFQGGVHAQPANFDPARTVTAQQEAEEAIAAWPEAVALAREVARPLVEALRAAPPPPTPAVTPTPAVVTPPVAPTVTYRRPIEAAAGAGLVAVGITLATTGLVSVLRDGSVAESLPDNVDQVYVAGARDFVLLGVGAAAAVTGVVLLVDGLRLRTRTAPSAGLTPAVTVSGQAMAFTLGARF